MLITLLAWVFITLLCWAWGVLLLQQLKFVLRDVEFPLPHFSIICMTGLAFVTVVAGILSLFFALGNWIMHAVVIIPCLLIFFQKPASGFFTQFRAQFKGLHPAMIFILIASLALVLMMCTWTINHPDTLTYHGQTIQWIEKYKAVPGLAHLHARYGYQGLWFVTEAFFNFRFAGISTLTLINSLVVVWYLLFIIQKINRYFIDGEWITALSWLLLFALSCWSYTQARLTITSASPDFITVLWLWMVFYLFIKKEASRSPVHWILMILLSIFAITLKLSAVPVVILSVYSAIQLWRLKKTKAMFVSFILALVILCPFLARNIITTGYLVFPSPYPDVINVDWKLDKRQTKFEKNYITAFARAPVEYDETEVKSAIAMSPNEWLPGWWRNQSIADKMILVLLLLSFPVAFLNLRALIRLPGQMKIALLTALAGMIFWFLQAPDPRFGFGFILAFVAMTGILVLLNLPATGAIFKKLTLILTLLSGITICSYAIYRSIYFFSPRQLIKPLGIEDTPYSSFNCDKIRFHKPKENEPCGDQPVPCVTTDSCNYFKLRGSKLSDGFRAK